MRGLQGGSMRLDHNLLLIPVLAVFLTTVVDGYQGSSALNEKQPAPQHNDLSSPRGPETASPVPKFGVVWEGKLTRSGLPKNEQGWKWLREQGVNGIVNFRARNNVDYHGYGFNHTLWIPMDNGRLPTFKEAEMYLAWIQDPKNQPINIQCAEGKDRTGMMAALARYAIDSWPMDKALNEASLYRRGEPLADARIHWLRGWAKRHPPGSHRSKMVYSLP